MTDAEKILAMQKPGDLFSPDMSRMRSEYKNLAKIWHPDVHSDNALAARVMSKINELHDEGIRLLQEGRWSKSNFVQFRSLDNRLHNITYLTAFPFELGHYYICNSMVVYAVNKQLQEFFDNYVDSVQKLRYADASMETEFKRFMPNIRTKFETADQFVVIVDKPTDVVSLRSVLQHYNRVLPDRHMAWILSSLYNIACFLYFNGIAHNGITLDNYFISPIQHNGMLLGGWWYATPFGQRMIGAPQNVHDIMSHKTKADKLATYTTDMDSIRQLGRQLVGDISGRSLRYNATIPKAILDWLLGASTKNPIEEYVSWGNTLDVGYGKRKFVEMKVTADDLYKK